jgi:multidrug efflux pump subunit AcrA (membrane-fusion protein)
MKVLKTLAAIFLVGILALGIFGCSSNNKATAATASQIYTVKRGNISLDITAAGNLALSVTEDVPIDLFYQGTNGRGGTVGQVNVQVGDTVKKGQVLASVDPSEWADQLSNLQDSVTTAQRNVSNKIVSLTDAQRQLASLQRAVDTANRAVASAQRTVDTKKLAVTAAQYSVQSANSTLNSISDVQQAKNQIDDATFQLRYATTMAVDGNSYWLTQKIIATQNLAQAQAYYNDIVTGTGITSSTDVALLIAQKYLALQQAQSAVIDAQRAVDDALTAVATAQQGVDDANYAVIKQQQSVVNTQADVDTANSSLQDTQKKLSDAQAMSPDVKAPFDGFVTAVNVKAGQSVNNGTIAATVADPTKFEANILISEMDIMKVSTGGQATMTVNALPGVTFPAQITQIAPTATISSGVVNYAVTVNITSIAPVTGGSFPGASSNATGRFPASANGTGGLSAALQQAVQSGRITQEQAQALEQQAASGQGFGGRTGGTGGSSSSGPSGSRAAGQLPSTTAQNYQLKQGLSGTIDLVVSQRNNVLLVPNGAITKSGSQSTVQVVTANNTTEKRVVQTGLSDWQNTEITSGLSEGEKIMIPASTKAAAPTTTSSQQRPPGGGILFGR